MQYYFSFICFQLVKNLPPSYRFWGIGNRLRVFFARRIAASVGKGVVIESGAHFHRELVMGDYSGLGIRCRVLGSVELGKHVMMGVDVVIHSQNHRHNRIDIPMCEQGFEERKLVVIEDDVWICDRVIIVPGVRIGKGSILAAGAVVAKNVPPFSVVAGNPGVVVKTRT